MGDALRPCETILWIAKRDGRVVVFCIDAYDRSHMPKQKRDRPGVTGGLILRIEGGNDKEESCLYLGFARGVACFPLMALV